LAILASIPIINLLVALWSLLIYFFIIRETHRVSDLDAIGILLLLIIIAIIATSLLYYIHYTLRTVY
ncbi:MAG: hypothetical protein ACP5FX_03055, partial [Candidatus Micrarchaeia archaeon]